MSVNNTVRSKLIVENQMTTPAPTAYETKTEFNFVAADPNKTKNIR